VTVPVLAALLLAGLEDQVEGRRVRAPVVYVGTVAEVRKVGSLDGPQGARMEAVLKDVKVVRGPAPADPEAPVSLRYDQAADPDAGGLYHSAAAGDLVVVFAGSMGKEYPLALVNGAAKVVGDGLRARRQWLLELDVDGLRAQGLTEAQRPEQARLYDRILAALGQPLQQK
jgi:hypothetical protein